MNQIGTNIAKGLTAGMDSESRNLSKTIKKICANLVKTAKTAENKISIKGI